MRHKRLLENVRLQKIRTKAFDISDVRIQNGKLYILTKEKPDLPLKSLFINVQNLTKFDISKMNDQSVDYNVVYSDERPYHVVVYLQDKEVE